MFLQHIIEGPLEKPECPEENRKEKCHEIFGKYLAERECFGPHLGESNTEWSFL